TGLLEEKLASLLASNTRSAGLRIATDTLADALIRLNAKPPTGTLESLFYGGHPAESLILMSRRGPETNEVLFGVLDRRRDLEWAAAANVLMANRAPGFVAALLRQLRLEAALVVCDRST